MPISPLSELNPGSRDWTVHVYVSRLWQHRGGMDDGPIKHTDIVFQDTQGNHMYGEISPGLVNDFMDRIREGKVYELRRFLVCQQKNCYRPVESQFIIRFGRYTTVREINDSLMDYPLCTYALTPIDSLPSPVDLPETFTDVAGIVTGVSPTSQYHSAVRATPSTKRVVYLSDLSGYEISVILWGEKATTFDADGVLRTAQKEAVVVLFVGTLIKPFEGRRGLSGGAPCRWYINEDLPEINELREQLKDKVPAIRGISLPGQTAAEISAQVDLETMTLKELVDLNIYDHAKSKFYCTVVITKLTPGERWWFHACTTCNKGTIPYGAAYKCPDKNCGGTGGVPRYRICYLGSDGTEEIEFVFFEKAGRELIGKPALTLIRSRVPRALSVEEAIQFARTDQSTPRELASIVSKKYRLVVSVSSNSFLPKSMKNSYQVHRIEMQHGKQPRSFAPGPRLGLTLASTSNSGCSSGLSPVGEALAEDLMLAHDNSSNTAPDVSDAPTSIDFAGSTIGSETVLPQTPPSVVKPAGLVGGKSDNISSVQKALFQDKSAVRELESSSDLSSQVQDEEVNPLVVADKDATPVPSAVVPEQKPPNGRKRSQSLKGQAAQADAESKKKKT